LIAANTHALLDRAENPETMLKQVVRDMEEGLAAARQQAARAIAAERRLQRELQQNRAAAHRWQEQARRALTAGREDLARKALAQKIEHDDLVKELEAQHAAADSTSKEVKAALRTLETRLAHIRH
jgi:phage shock protein A